jgi:hypothetical protein
VTQADPLLAPQAPGQLDPALAESAARQLNSASLTNYGVLPNPQLAWEAIQSGATPNVLGAIQSGDPQYQSLLTGTPAGQGLQAQQQAAVTPTLTDPSLYQMDWRQFWSTNQQQLRDDRNASWRSFGEIPVANFAYMQVVSNQKSPDRIKAWQRTLQKLGMLDHAHEVSGIWDNDTEAAFRAMMISRAMPDALYSKDAQTKDSARVFLGGLGLDVASLESAGRSDPTFNRTVVERWMGVQGPDARVGDRSQLSQFADQYGEENLPADWRQLTHENFLDWLRGGITHVFLPVVGGIAGAVVGGPMGAMAGAALGGLLDKAPGVDRAVNVATNTLTGNIFQHPGDLSVSPGQIKANSIWGSLQQADPAGAELLKPALQQVAADTGFMGLFDAWDRIRTRAVLTMAYAFGDAVSGKGYDNPFDTNNAAGRGAAAHQDNLIGGLFGDRFVHDHPTWATWGNLGANIMDDPISYIPVAGQIGLAEKLGMRSIRNFMSDDARLLLDQTLQGTSELHRDALAGLRGVTTQADTHGIIDGIHMLGEHTTGSTAWDRIGQIDQAMYGEDVGRASDIIQAEFRHGVQELRSFANRRAALKATGPEMMRRISGSRLSVMRTIGAFGAGDPMLSVLDDPIGTVEKFQEAAAAAGMDSSRIAALANNYLRAAGQGERYTAARQFGVELAQHLQQRLGRDYEGFVNHVTKSRSGKGFLRQYDDSKDVSIHQYAVDPMGHMRAPVDDEAAVEVSHLQKTMEVLQGQIEENRQLLRERFGDDAARAYAEHPEVQRLTAENEQRAQLIQKHIDDIQGLTRPAPVTPSQFGQTARLPFTPYEIASYLNPALRRLEAIQHGSHIDTWMSTWRRIVLSRPSTDMRIAVGDDAIRGMAWFVERLHPMLAAKLTANMLRKTGRSLLPGQLGEDARQSARVTLASQAQTDASKWLAEADSDVFVPYHPSHKGYAETMRWNVEQSWSKDAAMREWMKGHALADAEGARQSLLDWAKGQSADAVELRRVHHMDVNSPELVRFVDRLHDMYSANFQLPEVRRWVLDGSVKTPQLEKLVKDAANHPKLPVIMGRRRSAYGDNVVLRGLNGYTEWMWEHLTRPMVNAARSETVLAMRDYYAKHLQRVYKDTWSEQKVQQVADGWARNWLKNNTYQGTRSVTGQALRNVFPFWGATANMDRFWLRLAKDKPFVGEALLRMSAAQEQNYRNPNQHMTGFQGLLSRIGFTGGTALEFNPAHMLFLTSDGVASMIPGTGPIFAPLFSVMAHDQHLASILSDVPGVGEQVGYASGSTPTLFPWLADVVSGVGTAVTGHEFSLPMVGRSQEQIQRREDELIRQREAAGQAVTKADEQSIAREAGAEMLTQGALSFLFPVQPTVIDEKAKSVQNVLQEWSAAPDDASKDALIAQQLGISAARWRNALGDGSYLSLIAKNPTSIAALLVARDSRLPLNQRSQVEAAAPWVQAYNTSMYESAEQTPATLQQWQWDKAQGNIHLLSPDEYLTRLHDQAQVTNGWLAYDNLKQQEYDFLRQNGVTTASPQYRQWNQQTLQPQVVALEQAYPAWAKKFGSETRRDLAGMIQASTPLRSLQTWEVIPQNSDKETRLTTLWRQALVWRDDAAAALAEVRGRAHTQAEVDAIMQGLQGRLASLAQEDPAFAAQLDRTTFSRWQDIVTVEAMQQQAQQTGTVI